MYGSVYQELLDALFVYKITIFFKIRVNVACK